jgi:hypothetical protein
MANTVTLGNLVFKVSERPHIASPRDTLASGIPGIAFPRGAISEAVGAPSSGRATLYYATLAEATHLGEACVLIDAAGTFDPGCASAAGVRLPQLLWIRTNRNLEHALKAVDLLIHAGGFGLIVADLCGLPERHFQRVPLSYWYRCRRAVENTPAVMLVLEETAHAKACAALTIETEQEDTLWSGNLLEAVRYRAGIRKPAGSAPIFFSAAALG